MLTNKVRTLAALLALLFVVCSSAFLPVQRFAELDDNTDTTECSQMQRRLAAMDIPSRWPDYILLETMEQVVITNTSATIPVTGALPINPASFEPRYMEYTQQAGCRMNP